ncbi:MAG TPA: hypothetical protein VLJ10_02950, partial [Candidatus Bathyarchaeia archaeon]|nr:hypothetical protein [Candidatus Bathyarchaeia archaeon]
RLFGGLILIITALVFGGAFFLGLAESGGSIAGQGSSEVLITNVVMILLILFLLASGVCLTRG